jgi:deoxyribodipyrimidine photo-lyase
MENLPTNSLKLRLKKLGSAWQKNDGKAVLYVMSREQRVSDNYGLLAAQKHALRLDVPLAVVFCLDARRNNRALEHYEFMIQGLRHVELSLNKLNIPFIMLIGDTAERLSGIVYHINPVVVYVDQSPLSFSYKIQALLSESVPTIVVDSHNLVPVWMASNKQEFSARTLRPKLHKLSSTFLHEPEPIIWHPHTWPGPIITLDELDKNINAEIKSHKKNNTMRLFMPGEKAAKDALNDFLTNRFKGYAVNRNNPSVDGLSNLSPYLHFGQLSSIRIIIEAKIACETEPSLVSDFDTLFEELIVRKELSDNFCYYNKEYKSIKGAPLWAQTTLSKHANDKREYLYTFDEFKHAQTHDVAWNAAQNQLLTTGKIHVYMRMYWAKKILEWSKSPEDAIAIAIQLNDFYSIDGGDPNGYVGILWSVAGLHDRPWGERAVYGTVRSMVYSGLKRKFNIEEYIAANQR